MEPEGSLPHSQVPATCPYPEPARSNPYPQHPTSWRSILILSSHLGLVLPSGLFPSVFPTKTMYSPLFSPIRATDIAHLIFQFTKICYSGRQLICSAEEMLCGYIRAPFVKGQSCHSVCSRIFLENLIVSQLFQKSPHFMEPQCRL